MCCFFTVLVFLGPRIAGIVWWILDPNRWVGRVFGSAIWPILGLIFLPWTTLMYVAVAADPAGVSGFFDWAFLILAFIIDLGAYGGGGFGNRDRFGR